MSYKENILINFQHPSSIDGRSAIFLWKLHLTFTTTRSFAKYFLCV